MIDRLRGCSPVFTNHSQPRGKAAASLCVRKDRYSSPTRCHRQSPRSITTTPPRQSCLESQVDVLFFFHPLIYLTRRCLTSGAPQKKKRVRHQRCGDGAGRVTHCLQTGDPSAPSFIFSRMLSGEKESRDKDSDKNAG